MARCEDCGKPLPTGYATCAACYAIALGSEDEIDLTPYQGTKHRDRPQPDRAGRKAARKQALDELLQDAQNAGDLT